MGYTAAGGPEIADAVYSNMLKKVEIGKNTIPQDCCFCAATSLNSISTPSNFMDNDALPSIFDGCLSLESAIITRSSVDDGSYRNCTSLKTVSIPSSVTKLWSNCFNGCTALTNIVIPRSVTRINSGVFGNCTSMAYYDFTSHTSVPTLADIDAFEGNPENCEIRVPAKLHSEWAGATNWNLLFYGGYGVDIKIIGVKSNNPNTILFTVTMESYGNTGKAIDTYYFEAEKGMTWREFVNSSTYNTGEFSIDSYGNVIGLGNAYILNSYSGDIPDPDPDDLIVENYDYKAGL
jgi:hypothetical protein